jgi:CRP/FNR family cyclic AMP-dependent transcriptional regulator
MPTQGAPHKMTRDKNKPAKRGLALEGQELEDALRALVASPLLVSLSEGELSTLRGGISIRSYRAGAIVVKHGEVASSCFVIIRGKLAARRLDPSGKELTYKLLKAGEFFGELALLSDGIRSSDVVAEERSVLAEICAESFKLLLATSPSFSSKILTHVVKLAQLNMERLSELSFIDLNQRLLQTLTRMATSVELDGETRLLVRELPSRQSLASLLSCGREAVSRALKQLEDLGAIVMRDDQVEILRS